MKVIGLEQVTRWYRREKQVLNRIDMAVQKQETVLIIGSEGSGKTTLFQILSKREAPDEGTVKRVGRTALVYETFPYMKDLSVADYILLPLMLLGKKRKDSRRAAEGALKRCGLWVKRDRKAETLMADEKCRLMVAMAVVQEPDIIIMEHCGKHLTWAEEEQFWQFAGDWMKEIKATVICFSDKDIEAVLFDTKYRIINAKLEELNLNEKKDLMHGNDNYGAFIPE